MTTYPSGVPRHTYSSCVRRGDTPRSPVPVSPSPPLRARAPRIPTAACARARASANMRAAAAHAVAAASRGALPRVSHALGGGGVAATAAGAAAAPSWRGYASQRQLKRARGHPRQWPEVPPPPEVAPPTWPVEPVTPMPSGWIAPTGRVPADLPFKVRARLCGSGGGDGGREGWAAIAARAAAPSSRLWWCAGRMGDRARVCVERAVAPTQANQAALTPHPPAPHTRVQFTRSRTLGLPVYTDIKNGGTRVITIVRRYTGDAHALAAELGRVLGGRHVAVCTGRLEIEGNHTAQVKTWLAGLGF